MLIGVTDEPPSLVDEWMDKVQPEYPIVCLKNGDLEKFLGVQFFPTAAVIAPDGTLAFSGSAGAVAGPLGKALRDATKTPLFPKVFKKVSKALREGDYEKSRAELAKLIERGRWDEGEEAAAAQLLQYHEDLAVEALARAETSKKARRVYDAVQALAPFAEVEPELAVSAKLRAFLAELEAMPDYSKEMSGGEDFAEAEALERSYEFEDAFNAYKSISKKTEGTWIGELALEHARRLMDSGRPGWSQHCNACRASRQQSACEKHQKKVRL